MSKALPAAKQMIVSGSGTSVVMAPGWHIDKKRHGQ